MARSHRVPHRCAGYLDLPSGRVRCLARRTLRRAWTEYLRVPPCRVCGGRTYWIEQHRKGRKDRKDLCRCGAHPHRRASLALCVHYNPDAKRGLYA